MKNLSIEKALLKAKRYARKGKCEKAQELYRSILREDPHNRGAQLGLENITPSSGCVLNTVIGVNVVAE